MPQQVIVIENGQEFIVEVQSEVEHFVGSEMTVTYKTRGDVHYVIRQIAAKESKKVLIVDVLDEQALLKRKVCNFSRINSLSF